MNNAVDNKRTPVVVNAGMPGIQRVGNGPWDQNTWTQSRPSDAQRVLRNTYALLSMTLAFSAACAGMAMMFNIPAMHPFILLAVYFGLLFGIHKTINSGTGIILTFALTGFMGLTLGPIVNMFLKTSGGSSIVLMALGGTAIIFFGLSAVSLVTRKDFSFMGKTLFVGALVAFIAGIANIFLNIPALHLAVSSLFLIISSGLILYQTSEIIHGGEDNYVRATVSLFMSLYNIFLSLLQILGVMGGDRE
jgi:modulator of FtsH protease